MLNLTLGWQKPTPKHPKLSLHRCLFFTDADSMQTDAKRTIRDGVASVHRLGYALPSVTPNNDATDAGTPPFLSTDAK